jgi:hypothetical protein
VRGERLGITVGVLGLGATLLTAALALGGVKVSAVLLWVMGGVGVLLMLAGVFMLLVRRNVAPVSTDRGHGAPPEAPSSPTGRVGYKGRPGSIGKFRGTTFGERLDTDIDNEGDVNVEDSDLK